MRPIPYRELVLRAFAELRAKGSIFDIPAEHCFRPSPRRREPLLGPAAGPHTQLAQNILCAYLCGARAIELKTVQKLDNLEIEKPCIDAADEGYNVEWSTELSLDAAYDEYLKAWFLLHVAEALLEGAPPSPPSFEFTMSIGYDLEGIRGEKMDRFIGRLIDSSAEELFDRYRRETAELAALPGLLAGTPWESPSQHLRKVSGIVSPRLSSTVTLSTMHGCPPGEIESICRYLLEEKQLDTLVKLNPTLLGHDRVRGILDGLGFEYVQLDRHGFEKDLQYADAVPMLTRLLEAARRAGRRFGVKLTNTLATANTRGVLPGKEMYLSGRALYPLSMSLAADLAAEFSGRLPMSLSGGAAAWNIAGVLEAGIRPVTLATELLKPGGYSRLRQLAEIAEAHAGRADRAGGRTDPASIRRAAEAALHDPRCRKEYRGTDAVRVEGPLPLFDCFVAPCIEACPIGQDVPGYIRLAGEGRYRDAFALIHEANPLPFITAYLCDHQCMRTCTRMDWEGTVLIRDMKRVAAENGCEAFRAGGSAVKRRAPARGVKAAVIGAGPAGLAAASFLAREGFGVHVYEREREPGGVVRHAVPAFRVPVDAIAKDVSLLEDLGVRFHFGSTATIEGLRADGARYILAAIGAERDRGIGIDGAHEALAFLREFRSDPKRPVLGRSVVVVGAGDTAMDAARAARRCRGVREVRLVYRRSEREMPASREELEDARAEGVSFHFLRAPERWAAGTLACRVMRLGESDASGRPRPVPTDELESFPADAVITATGTEVDPEALEALGIAGSAQLADPVTQETPLAGVFLLGDAATGASTIVKAIASARKAVQTIVEREGSPQWTGLTTDLGSPADPLELRAARYRLVPAARAGRAGRTSDATLSATESARCLGCNALCLKCVEVCPNRANTYVSVIGGFRDAVQVLH
ncbi:MAG: putative selenate reductase subunit YgfK, partial [Spirochaetes bacterium]|nr:putative selenate reductase subunit YgfK [Spirochaetota bacterium]